MSLDKVSIRIKDKKELERDIGRLVAEFENKHQDLRVEEIGINHFSRQSRGEAPIGVIDVGTKIVLKSR